MSVDVKKSARFWPLSGLLMTLLAGLQAILAAAISAPATSAPLMSPVKVSIEKTADGYQLLRAGKPYVVKGAGLDVARMESLAAYGGNSFRTWFVDTEIKKGLAMLDKAHSLGLTVSLCLNIDRERLGFDYSDPEQVQGQYMHARQAVLAYKDHPALFSWVIGNELNLGLKNPRVYDAVNDLSKMIHALDPNHPTTTTVAGFDPILATLVSSRAADIDFLSIQLYGALLKLPQYIKEADYRLPYFVTEWGAIGHWEVGKTPWGAPIEPNSSEKAKNYRDSYARVIAASPHQLIGNYVFLWGQKQERTPTWYGMFTETGEATEAIDVLAHAWNPDNTLNQSPRVTRLTLDDRAAGDDIYLQPGQTYLAQFDVVDPEGQALSYAWSIKPESSANQEGGDFEHVIADLPGLLLTPAAASMTVKAPSKPGAYRLFTYAYDGRGSAAHGNIPFYVGEPGSPK
jgi:hypothetical protein